MSTLRFAFAILTTVTVTLGPVAALACQCWPPTTLQEELDAADVILRGTVVSVGEYDPDDALAFASVRLSVDAWARFDGHGFPVEVTVEWSMFQCPAVTPEVGSQYIVIADRSGNRLSTSECERTDIWSPVYEDVVPWLDVVSVHDSSWSAVKALFR